MSNDPETPTLITLTPGQKAETIEACRAQLEAELRNLTGLNVALQAYVFSGDDDTQAREVAHETVKAGWTVHRGGTSLWTKSHPFEVCSTSIHIKPRIHTLTPECNTESIQEIRDNEAPEFP